MGTKTPCALPSFLVLAGSLLPALAQDNFLILPLAGNAQPGFSGDGGSAIAAGLNWPTGLAVDAAGNLYISDSQNNRIRKVTPAGVITTVAGSGQKGFSGDGGPATAAALSSPTGLAIDAAGNLYISDSENNRVRKVTPAGIISTVAGTGQRGYSGDGGQAVAAALNWPTGLAVDSTGNLYIADMANARIRKVSPAGIISTVAGSGQPGFGGDGGAATNARLNSPPGVAVDAAGNLYIADSENNRIRKVTPAGIISTVAGSGQAGFSGDSGTATAAGIGRPWGLALDRSGNLYIADTANARIRKVNPSGIITSVAGSGQTGFTGDGGPATAARLNWPAGLAADASGSLYIADSLSHRIRKLVPSPSPTAGCAYSLGASGGSFEAAGGNGSVPVTVNQAACRWLAGSYVDWVTVTAGSSGTGTGSVSYSVSPNDSSASRSGSLWIAGETFTISQSGRACSYTITPAEVSVPAGGATGNTVKVTATASDCRWAITGVPSWILIGSGTSGVGSATVTYTVGPNTGGFRSATFQIAGLNFTVYQAPAGGRPPAISADAVVNAASSLAGPLAPGEFISIYGTNLGPDPGVASKFMEKALATTRVFFNGIEAFLTYASAGQVNALVPYGVAGTDRLEVQLEYQAMKSNSVRLSAADAAPGIFTRQYGAGQAWVANQDGTFNSTNNPADRGTYIAFWATGQGQVNPAGVDGALIVAPNFPVPRLPVKVTVGGAEADVVFAGLIYAGVMQVNVKIPDNAPVGNAIELLIRVGNYTSRSGVTVAVR